MKDERLYGSSNSHSSHQVKASLAARSKRKTKELVPPKEKARRNALSESSPSKLDHTIPISNAIKAAEKRGECVINFQI